MRLSRLSPLLVCAVCAGLWACNQIIGTKEIFLVDNEDSGGVVIDGGPPTDARNPSGDSSVPVDSGPCGDTLSSGTNCGTCNHSCLGGMCMGGICQPVALSSSISPRDIAVDANHVYWIEPNVAHAMQANLDGSKPVQLGGGTSNLLEGMAIDGTNVFWGSLDGLVLRCKIGGCANTPADVSTAADGIIAVAVDATNVYWAGGSSTSQILKVAKGLTMASGTVLATSTAQIGSFNRLATDGTSVYWTADDGMVRRVPVGGGAMTIVAKGVGAGGNIVLDDTNVYWSISDSGTIDMAPKDGAAVTATVLAASQAMPLGLAVDANDIFWVNVGSGIGGTDGSVMTCTIASCTPKPLAKNQATPVNITIDATAIYWSNFALGNPTGAVMRLAR